MEMGISWPSGPIIMNSCVYGSKSGGGTIEAMTVVKLPCRLNMSVESEGSGVLKLGCELHDSGQSAGQVVSRIKRSSQSGSEELGGCRVDIPVKQEDKE
jgi:hypothetical protein